MDQAALFERYVDICNQALAANKDRFPFKHILEAVAADGHAPRVDVCIVDDKPEASYILQLDGLKIESTAKELPERPAKKSCGKTADNACCGCSDTDAAGNAGGCADEWVIGKSYLEDVVQNADSYIATPARLNWEWLQKAPSAKGASTTVRINERDLLYPDSVSKSLQGNSDVQAAQE